MLTKESKSSLIKNLKDNYAKSQGVFLTNLVGLTANDAVVLRREVRKHGGEVLVVKNTLLRKAFEGSDCSALFQKLKGPHAVAFAYKEVAAVAKVFHEQNKTHEFVDLKAGFFEGKVLNAQEAEMVAKLPSKKDLLAMLLATFNAPISAFVRTLEQIRLQKETNK